MPDGMTFESEIARSLRRAFGRYTTQEWHALPIWARHEAMAQRKRDWIKGLVNTPFIQANNPEPVLRGSAAIGSAYVTGLEALHRAMLERQAK